MKKILSKLSVPLLIISLIGVVLTSQATLIFFSIDKANALLSNLRNTTEQQMPSSKALSNADMMHDGIRAVVLEAFYSELSGKTTELEKISDEAIEKSTFFSDQMKVLAALKLSPTTREALEKTNANVAEYSTIAIDVTKTLAQGKRAEANALKESFDSKFEVLEESLGKLNEMIEKDAKESSEAGKDIIEVLMKISIWGLFISLIMSAVVFMAIKSSLAKFTHDLEKTTESTLGLSKSVSAKMDDLLKANQSQEMAINESASSISEINSLISRTSENVKQSNTTANHALSKSDQGQLIMSELNSSMQQIKNSNQLLLEISKVIDGINKKAQVINDIVFKTQLLSFNASIEAARAGQHGRGFAVVAEEVGNLADSSGKAAKEIEVLISESHQKVENTVQLIQSRVNECDQVSQKVQASLTEITTSINQIHQQIESIGSSANEQIIGIDRTNSAIKKMSSSAQISLRASEDASESSAHLLTENSNLNQVTMNLNAFATGRKQNNGHVKQSA